MASFSGRRAPNMSQYIAGLNSTEPQPYEDNSFLDQSLTGFVSTDFTPDNFFDFSMGSIDGLNGVPDISPVDTKSTSTGWQPTSPVQGDLFNGDLNFDLNNFGSGNGNGFNFNGMPQSSSTTSPSATSPAATHPARTGEKRKSTTASVDETARLAAEEDKRRRNTAASARFRVKKKAREATLEKTAKDMTEKASALEIKVQQLEMENSWLKSLITEKDMAGDADLELGGGGLDELFEKYKSEQSRSIKTQQPDTD